MWIKVFLTCFQRKSRRFIQCLIVSSTESWRSMGEGNEFHNVGRQAKENCLVALEEARPVGGAHIVRPHPYY